MKDQLLDIVQHTHGLGFVDLVKVIGTETETKVSAVATERLAVIDATFAGPVADFVGTFGMPNLGTLSTILGISEYKEDAKVTMRRKASGEPEDVNFENKSGDFKNNYRLMEANIVDVKLPPVTFNGVKWDIEIEPSNQAIQRLKFQASANSNQTTFTAKTDNGTLKFFFGDHSNSAGDFVFATGITGSLSKSWAWPVGFVIAILSLPGNKTLRISDKGAAQITVDSGVAVWNYTLPAQTK
jgi:hypothetical protein